MSTALIEVTRAEFFAVIGPRDIVLRTEREYTAWETRTREVVGKTTPGYANTWTPQGMAPRVYMLSAAAHKTLKGAS